MILLTPTHNIIGFDVYMLHNAFSYHIIDLTIKPCIKI